MTFRRMPELRKWRRVGPNAVVGNIHGSEVFDEGEGMTLFPGEFREFSNFFLFYMDENNQYRLPKDEEMPSEPKNGFSST